MGVMAWESSRRESRAARQSRTSPEETGDWLLVGAVATGLTLLVVETFSLWYRLDAFVPTLLSLIAIHASLIGVGLIAAAALPGPRWLDRLALIAFALAGAVLLISFLHTLADWRVDWRTLTESGAPDTLWRLLLINPRGIGFLVAVIAAAAGGILWKRLEARDSRTSLPFDAGALLGLGCVLTGFVWLTAETYAWGVIRERRTTTSLAITLVWTLYSAAVLIAGIALRSSGLRKLSLRFFVLTTGKVFLFDVWQLETAIRTFAFMALGVALLTVSWLYRRHRERIREWIKAEEGTSAAALPRP